MFRYLLLAFIVVPIVELFVIVQVAGGLGVFPTIALLLLVSIFGAWLVRREGTGIFRKVQEQLNSGEMPTDTVIDGFLVLFAGALLLTPGFFTDALGFTLLIPPSRAAVRKVLAGRFKGRIATFSAGTPGPGWTGSTTGPGSGVRFDANDIFDTDATDSDADPEPGSRGELGDR